MKINLLNFLKGKKKKPTFTLTRNFHKRNFYFVRIVEWGWLDAVNIFVKDHHRSKIITLDPWAANIFLSAHGTTTVEEYVHYVAGQYGEDIPENLEQTIIFEMVKLNDLKFISMIPDKQPPAAEFDKPAFGEEQ